MFSRRRPDPPPDTALIPSTLMERGPAAEGKALADSCSSPRAEQKPSEGFGTIRQHAAESSGWRGASTHAS
eukprot:8488453-Pyramimonas_sp.AAC.1